MTTNISIIGKCEAIKNVCLLWNHHLKTSSLKYEGWLSNSGSKKQLETYVIPEVGDLGKVFCRFFGDKKISGHVISWEMLPLFCSLVKVKMSFFVAWRKKKDVKTPASQRCLGRKTVIKQQGSCWPRKISVELSTNEDLMQSTKAAPHFSPNFLTVSFLLLFRSLNYLE